MRGEKDSRRQMADLQMSEVMEPSTIFVILSHRRGIMVHVDSDSD